MGLAVCVDGRWRARESIDRLHSSIPCLLPFFLIPTFLSLTLTRFLSLSLPLAPPRYKSALKLWVDTLEERDRVEAHYQTTIFDMKSMLEERIKRADDISKAYQHFKLEVRRSHSGVSRGFRAFRGFHFRTCLFVSMRCAQDEMEEEGKGEREEDAQWLEGLHSCACSRFFQRAPLCSPFHRLASLSPPPFLPSPSRSIPPRSPRRQSTASPGGPSRTGCSHIWSKRVSGERGSRSSLGRVSYSLSLPLTRICIFTIPMISYVSHSLSPPVCSTSSRPREGGGGAAGALEEHPSEQPAQAHRADAEAEGGKRH